MGKEIVYKFRNFSSEKHIRWIQNNEIFFASPASFNDPFDCAINIRYDLLDEGEKLQKYRSQLRAEYPQWSKKEILKEAKNWMRKGLLTKEKQIEANERIFNSLTSNKLGILSLTKVKSPILLWSHYANYHQGYSIGYDKVALENYLVEKFNTIKLVPFWFDVEYQNEYPIIIPNYKLSDIDYMTLPFKTKFDVWKYESEYRIMILGGTNIPLTVPLSLITEISLGCKISKQNKDEIQRIIDEKKIDVPIFQSRKHEEKFELVFEKI
jgi:hypothetical protein